jgi:histidinol-phosphate aminotransferase
VASLNDDSYFRESCERVMASRDSLTASMQALGFDVLPSAANFIFASHPKHDAKRIFEALREQGVIVRYFNKPRIDQYLRISIGTEEQSDSLLQALRELLA